MMLCKMLRMMFLNTIWSHQAKMNQGLFLNTLCVCVFWNSVLDSCGSWTTVRCCYNAVNFLRNHHDQHYIDSPARARCGIYFVGTNSYLCSVNVVLYRISCYIGVRYNGTRLYLKQHSHTGLWPTILYKFVAWIPFGNGENKGHDFLQQQFVQYFHSEYAFISLLRRQVCAGCSQNQRLPLEDTVVGFYCVYEKWR